jgi:hypothetical protein
MYENLIIARSNIPPIALEIRRLHVFPQWLYSKQYMKSVMLRFMGLLMEAIEELFD